MAGLSYYHNPCKTPHVYRTIPDLLDQNVRINPDKIAHVFWTREHVNGDIRRQTLSFRQLADESFVLASGLLELGLQPGHRIAMYGPASPEWIQMELACLRIGVLMVGLPQTLVYSAHLRHFLADHKCRVLLLDPRPDRNVFKRITENSQANSTAMTRMLKLPGSSATAGLELVISTCRVPGYDDVMLLNDVKRLAHDDISNVKQIQDLIDPDEIAVVNATSGSTGMPKVVAKSQYNLVCIFSSIEKEIVLFNDRLFSWMGSICHFPSVSGGTHVHVEASFTSNSANLPRLFEILGTEGAYMAALPAFLVYDFISALDDGRIKQPVAVKIIRTGGEKLHPEVRQKILDRSFSHIVIYGSTEGGLICLDHALAGTQLPSSDTEKPPAMPLVDDLEVKVTDEDKQLIPFGEVGQLWIRGPLGFIKYLDDDVQTSMTKSPCGWINTGDLAALESSGNIRLYGRAADVISKGGVKVYPSGIEAIINRHNDVETSYVTGIPDVKYNEEIGACVVLKPGCDVTVEELRSFCVSVLDVTSGISLVPKYMIILNKMPVLPSLKVDRMLVKSMLSNIK
jgi:fatty-acyl-CoA synthase